MNWTSSIARFNRFYLVTAVVFFAGIVGLKAGDGDLPDLFRLENGQTVTNVQMWQNERRPEILDLFRENIYGKVAEAATTNALKFKMTKRVMGAMSGKADLKQVEISFIGPRGTGTIHLTLFVPTGAGPVPCFVLICNRDPKNIDPTRQAKSDYWPAETIIDRGYAAAAFWNADVVPDETNAFNEGVFKVFDPAGKRSPDAWGAIAAWAWGASRVMDYLQTDPDIDPQRIAVVGHSRGGKTALWAGASDERFAMAVSNESGSTGAALARHKSGERIRDINERFPHWFCENYRRYNDHEELLPVDQHMLAALIAPRLLYIASAAGDAWSDPTNEFLAAVNAQPAYRLFGLQGLSGQVMPEVGHPLLDGHIGYHIRAGEHNLTAYDWEQFLNFADKHLKKAAPDLGAK